MKAYKSDDRIRNVCSEIRLTGAAAILNKIIFVCDHASSFLHLAVTEEAFPDIYVKQNEQECCSEPHLHATCICWWYERCLWMFNFCYAILKSSQIVSKRVHLFLHMLYLHCHQTRLEHSPHLNSFTPMNICQGLRTRPDNHSMVHSMVNSVILSVDLPVCITEHTMFFHLDFCFNISLILCMTWVAE